MIKKKLGQFVVYSEKKDQSKKEINMSKVIKIQEMIMNLKPKDLKELEELFDS